MNHFNFFENTQNDERTLNLSMLCLILAACAVIVLGGMYLKASSDNKAARSNLAYLESVENNPDFQLQYAKEKNLEKKLSKTEEDFVFLYIAGELASDGSTVSDEVVSKIMSFFDKNANIIKLDISGTSVTIDGVSSDLDKMISIEKALNESGLYDGVFISTAKQDSHTGENGEDAVEFHCSFTLKQEDQR